MLQRAPALSIILASLERIFQGGYVKKHGKGIFLNKNWPIQLLRHGTCIRYSVRKARPPTVTLVSPAPISRIGLPMPTPLEKLAAYDIRGMIAPGGSSVVLSALKKDHPFRGAWKVAIKFVWRRELAREEARNLINLDAHRGVVNLLDYFEIPFAEVERYFQMAVKGINPFETMERQNLEILAEEHTGVLVLQFLAGSTLVRHTTTAVSEHEEFDPKQFFLIQNLESGTWLKQELSWDLSLGERIDILQQITRHIDECHQRKVVHADLNPQNILYEPESQRVTILDFGGSTSLTRGSPGWQAPEHFKLAEGELKEVPLKLDVFLLGLFINRLMQPFHIKGFRQLAERCLSPLAKRPSAKEVAAEIGAIERRLFKTRAERFGIPTLAALLLLSVAWGLYLYLNRAGPTLRDRYGKDDGYALVEEVLDLEPAKISHPKTIRDELDTIFSHQEAWPGLRANVSLAKAHYFRKFAPGFSGRAILPESIKAVWYYPGEFYIKTDIWLEVGNLFTPQHYLSNVTYQFSSEGKPIFYLHLVNFNKEEKILTIDHFPFVGEAMAKGFLFIHQIFLEDLIQFVANLMYKKIRFEGSSQTPSRGVLYFESKQDLWEQLNHCYTSIEDVDGVRIFQAPRQEEFLFDKFSRIQIPGEKDFFKVVHLILGEVGLTFVDDRDLLKNKRTLRSVEAVKVDWQVFLNMILEQHQLESKLLGDKVYIIPKEYTNR